ncbi:D-glycero-alpha-D-manno-heptose-7-phosphate kinase [Variovorax sp. TBS-050B]|uniref:GHMP family kinase ATP-binding protein n=1 Tax=Variovorax sp. TBS-050B TaxID=2940551 RepID=UPI002473FC0F|nr:dehydrogenase [Variovorax sp. TBS-050B]MDH6592544.1 D-glycero-alpha-D-manno-heptose-7-phosphate kinase [Variovorax sp. TBS-050B]
MKTIRARAPLRLGLAGGGTDISSYCDVHGGCVLNATIDRYAYAVIRESRDGQIKFEATDKQAVEKWRPTSRIALDGGLDLHKAVYNHFVQNHLGGASLAIELSTFCDAPIGSGLGSSSTLVVAMIRAFVELLNLPFDDYMIAQLAYQIERVDCGLQGGRQDQYSATFGGFNFMEFFAAERTLVNPLRIRSSVICELEASLVLFFTGVSRESARIIADQSANVGAGKLDAIEAMHGLKREALTMKDCLLRGDFEGLVESMRSGWENKKRSARTVSNPEIDRIYATATSAGALAGKVSGAGGGGFMLFFAPNERRLDVIRALNNFDGQVSNCHFTKNGAQTWRI